jgi:hypothetical protein
MFMVTPNKTHELAWAVEKVVTDEKLRERLVNNANDFATSYSWESSLAKLLGVYRQCAPELTEFCEVPVAMSDELAAVPAAKLNIA